MNLRIVWLKLCIFFYALFWVTLIILWQEYQTWWNKISPTFSYINFFLPVMWIHLLTHAYTKARDWHRCLLWLLHLMFWEKVSPGAHHFGKTFWYSLISTKCLGYKHITLTPAFTWVVRSELRPSCLHTCSIFLAQSHIFNSWKVFVEKWLYYFDFLFLSFSSSRDPFGTLYMLGKGSITELHISLPSKLLFISEVKYFY